MIVALNLKKHQKQNNSPQLITLPSFLAPHEPRYLDLKDRGFVFALETNPSQLSSISTKNKIITSKTARSKSHQATQIRRNLQTNRVSDKLLP
jgi:hypothetical protein